MSGILFDYLLLLWVLVSILVIGVAFCHRFARLAGIELIGYGLGAGVLFHGLLGLLIALDRHLRHYVVFLTIVCAATAIGYLIRHRVWTELTNSLTRSLRLSLFLWLVFLGLCVALVHVEVRWPAELQDGQYIFKQHSLNVKIQYLTALPADNYIAYTVTEFFNRNISFKKVRPILPANEVSNRTILMSLVALPFRTALSWGQRGVKDVGTFHYVGHLWPDVEKLNEDNSFEQFLIVGIFLNSLLLVGLLVLFSNFDSPNTLPVAALLFVTSPYFIGQTIFTWPKAMAGFFIVLSWNSIRRQHDAKVVALCLALAFHSHPSSIAVAVSIGLWYALKAWREKSGFKSALEYAGVFVLAILPWEVWTGMVLKIPSNMFAQNFAGAGTAEALASPINFIWIRAANAFTTLTPVMFVIYPFEPESVVGYATTSLPTVVGLFLIGFAVLECIRLATTERMLVWHGLIIPAAVILALYSCRAIPVLHGWQSIVGVLMFLAVLRMRRTCRPSTFRLIVLLQLMCNLAVLSLRGAVVGAHL